MNRLMIELSSRDDVEASIRRVEELLSIILEKLESIEKLLKSSTGEEVSIAFRLMATYSLPVIEALEAARRYLEATRRIHIGLDEISRVILEVLSDCKPKSLSEITQLIRNSRGKASRRIIREKIKQLTSIGLVKDIGTPNRHQYTLVNCREK